MVKRDGLGRSVPPQLAHVKIYFDQQGMREQDAEAFFNEQEHQGWHSEHGHPITNWKTAACNWIWELKRAKVIALQLKRNRLR